MNDRYILHCDIDYCFAQIEVMKNPLLRDIPMCVGGDESLRHGIVLARNPHAKELGVQTAETLMEARRKCPNLIVVPPSYQDYLYYSEKVKDIYRSYSDKVESFGIDEAWVDVTHSIELFGKPGDIAVEIRKRVWDELGLTVSIGMSFNKVFAKLGSDMNKPDGLTILMKDHLKSHIWPLPAKDLLYVGGSTNKRLHALNIKTIGDIATADRNILIQNLGKMGAILQDFALGYDSSIVNPQYELLKSVGNGITPPTDLVCYTDAKIVFYVLCESIASRLKELGMRGTVIRISLRDTKLNSFSRQKKLKQPTNVVEDIMATVMSLLTTHWDESYPLRSITLTLSDLVEDASFYQQSLFDTENQSYAINHNLDLAIDEIRSRFGSTSVRRCSTLLNKTLTSFNPKEDHTIYPVGFFKS